jgi:hypothetical protein
VGRANFKPELDCCCGPGPVKPFSFIQIFSNSSITFQMSSSLKIQNTILLKSKNFQTCHGCIQFQREQISFLAELQNLSGLKYKIHKQIQFQSCLNLKGVQTFWEIFINSLKF